MEKYLGNHGVDLQTFTKTTTIKYAEEGLD
jgi:hypothetical protein